jgi:hypothetical protein
MLDAARVSFTATTAAIRAGLLGGTILQFDETGLRVGKMNWWLWVFHRDDSAFFVVAGVDGVLHVADEMGEADLIVRPAHLPAVAVGDPEIGPVGVASWRLWKDVPMFAGAESLSGMGETGMIGFLLALLMASLR